MTDIEEGIMKRALLFHALAAALGLTFAFPVQSQDFASQIVGVWKVISLYNKETATGKIVNPYGEKPNGYIIYTKGGRIVFTVVAGEGRPKPGAAGATDVERATLFSSLATGSGTYKVDGDAIFVTYDVSWHELWTGTTQ